MDDEPTKLCPRCGETKPIGEFYRNPKNSRVYPYCRPCNRVYQRERKLAKQSANSGDANVTADSE